ncbi:hypothetical protein GCM10023324_47060 [Streptomyces youssoufiensis]
MRTAPGTTSSGTPSSNTTGTPACDVDPTPQRPAAARRLPSRSGSLLTLRLSRLALRSFRLTLIGFAAACLPVPASAAPRVTAEFSRRPPAAPYATPLVHSYLLHVRPELGQATASPAYDRPLARPTGGRSAYGRK